MSEDRPTDDASWPPSGVGGASAPEPRRDAAPKRVLGAAGFLLDALRRRRSGRIALWSVVVLLAVGGLGLLAWPFITDVWADRIQDRLKQELATSSDTGTSRSEFKATLGEGKALTRLVIPRLRVNTVVVEGTSGNALRAGAGHYRNTPLPGEPGNVAIAGHRTGFGEPFRHVDRLREGDSIELHTPFGRYAYRVIGPFDGHDNPWITHAKDWSVIGPTPQPSLTLTTCDPPGTSKNRLIVRAVLVGSQPIT